MRKILIALVAVLALVGVSTPARAVPVVPAVQSSAQGLCYPTVQSGCQVAPYTIYNGYKWTVHFYPDVPTLCIADGIGQPTAWPVATAAQAWNNASTGVSINVKNNCVTAGYSPGRRATIDTYSALDSRCVRLTNLAWTTYGGLGFRVWTDNPVIGVQVNTNYNCNSTGQRRAHWISVGIGKVLGLTQQAASQTGFASRVMCDCSQDTVAYPSASTDGPAVTKLYAGDYVGPCYYSSC